jgi:hypothetical protein
MGEYDMKFQKKAAGPQVMFKDTTGAVSSGSLESDAAQQGRHLTLIFTKGPMQGTTLKGAYDSWEPSDETEQMAFYFGAPGDAAPADINTAMSGTGKTVYVMSRCGHGAVKCDFDTVFDTKMVAPLFMEKVTDPCSAATDCGGCVNNAAAHCFWCPSGPVTYTDGSKGTQCAGFAGSGSTKQWTCDKGATQICPTPPPPPAPMFKCQMNADGPTCTKCAAAKLCKKDADCGASYCHAGVCHGSAPEGCSTEAGCTDLAKHNCTQPDEDYAICDQWTKTCKAVPKGTKGAVTKYECEHKCVGAKVTGTYRAISISDKFLRGEYDFTFYDDATMHWKAPDGTVSVAQLAGSQKHVADGVQAVEGKVIKSSDSSVVGTKVYAIMKRDEQGNDGIAKFMFMGMDKAPLTDLGAAMSKQEWVMTACKEAKPCDFSKATVAA